MYYLVIFGAYLVTQMSNLTIGSNKLNLVVLLLERGIGILMLIRTL